MLSKVAKIDVKQETPVDHGEIICFSIYSGPEADFGGGKSCIWVDVLDGGGKEIFNKFADFFQDSSIKKVTFSYCGPFFALNPITPLDVHLLRPVWLIFYKI